MPPTPKKGKTERANVATLNAKIATKPGIPNPNAGQKEAAMKVEGRKEKKRKERRRKEFHARNRGTNT
jgi:hypothetical protein